MYLAQAATAEVARQKADDEQQQVNRAPSWRALYLLTGFSLYDLHASIHTRIMHHQADAAKKLKEKEEEEVAQAAVALQVPSLHLSTTVNL